MSPIQYTKTLCHITYAQVTFTFIKKSLDTNFPDLGGAHARVWGNPSWLPLATGTMCYVTCTPTYGPCGVFLLVPLTPAHPVPTADYNSFLEYFYQMVNTSVLVIACQQKKESLQLPTKPGGLCCFYLSWATHAPLT